MPTREDIKEYYDFSKLDYQIYNLAASNISMHYGLWDKNVRSHKEALLNENKVLAELAQITKEDHVLDLGCGYGTTAIWLAENIGCKVTGITISEKQVREASEAANKRGVGEKVDFHVMDFNGITFPQESFSAALSIESICHSDKQSEVLKRIYQVLKPGGRLVVADGYFAKDKTQLTAREKEIANACFEGVKVPPLAQRDEFEKWIEEAGFSDIRWHNKTKQILKISKKISGLAKWFLPVSKLLGVVGVKSIQTSHVKAFINQYYAWRDGIGIYGIFVAKKTEENV